MSDSPRINIPNVILLSKQLTSTSSIVITRNHTPNVALQLKRPLEDNVDVEHLNPKRLKFTEQSGTPPLGSLKELNKRKKSERCNHCLRSDHVRITSINCLRNPKNPNYNSFQKTVETPINANNFDSNEMFEYTINTQSSVPTQSVSSSHTQNSPLFITNTSRVRTPLQQQQKNYLNEFNSKKNGPLHQQNWVNEKLKKFHNEMDDLKQFFCENCHELWPSKINHCTQCSIDNVKYSKLNDMVPGIDELDPETKKAFEDLTVVEEILISPILVIMSVYRLPGGALSSRGFCANFSQDIQPIVTLLPRLPQNIPLLILKKKDQKNNTRHFVVNKRRVLICLNYLCKNNPQYIAHNIRIDEDALNLLPENSVPESLREFECLDNDLTIDKGPELNENNDNLDIDDDFYNTYVEEDENQILLDDKIKNAINFPNASQNTLNEYQNDSICSLAFPKLFPNGAGDPTKKARLKEVTESLAFKHLMKSAAKSYKNGHFYYAWAKHQRFKFWAYDRLRRHRSLDQCKVFFKHNVHEANLSMNQLKSMINTPESNLLMKKMSTYSANITGSDAYWYKRRGELEATFEQKKTATAFFTFSYPDHHWEELHNLMPGPKANSQSEKYKNLMDNPHLVDWFFSYRLNEFLKVVFDDILDCDWRWHRYEWQSRSSIHAHGAVKFKNDPDLVKLTTEVYIGRLAEKKIENKQYDSEEVYNQLINDVKKGKESEELVINYTDTLITAMNSKTNFAENCVPTPHPCSIKTSNINIDNLENDYENLINCCQRHVCRINGYCKSKVSGKCRFTYPFELQEKTKINFIETKDSVKAEIVLMRNDPWMNMHNRIICHNWRGNVDMQIILDKSAAIKYMVKYATKGEKAGQALCQLFKEIIQPSAIEDNPSTKMRSLMIKSIAGKRDIGQCEVSRLLLSEPLYNSSFNYVTISTEIDSRELNLDVNDDDDSPATKNSLIDYYANRKQIDLIKNQLVKIDNLVSFVKYFKLDNKNKLSIRTEHEKTVVITLPKIRYNPDDIEMYKIYCYHQTIKYSDWDISNINEIRNKNSAIERWNNFLRNASSEILEMIGFTTELSKQLKEARKEIELDPEIQLTRDQWMILSEIGPSINNEENEEVDDVNPDTTHDFLSHRQNYTEEVLKIFEGNYIKNEKKKVNEDDDDNSDGVPNIMESDLNEDQKLVYKLVTDYEKSNKQLLLIVNGTAGTGKSYTINAISNHLKNKLKRCAPTAKAAFLIKGSTLHSLFRIRNIRKKEAYIALTGKILQEFQRKFRGITHIIIDEYSMLSQAVLGIIDKRLREATGKHDTFFGGISIILTGDPGQLLPVIGSPLYHDQPKDIISTHGLDCYKQFDKAVCLKIMVRQQADENDLDQINFINVLERLRNGINDDKTIDDWKFLLKREIKPNNIEEFSDAIRLFPDNSTCTKYNHTKLKELNMPICRLNAENNPPIAKNINEEYFYGLNNTVNIAINSKITLTTNLWTSKGLVNGANGIIRDIIYPNETNYRNGLPSVLLIEFDYYIGPRLFPEDDYRHNWIPINCLEAHYNILNYNRRQFPIRLAYALTIHKSQGQTISKAVIDLGKKEQSLGLTFVALSRLKHFNDFLIQPMTLERIQKLSQSKMLEPRLNEEKRIKKIELDTLEYLLNL